MTDSQDGRALRPSRIIGAGFGGICIGIRLQARPASSRSRSSRRRDRRRRHLARQHLPRR